jgi:seryl-tRNA synthetase
LLDRKLITTIGPGHVITRGLAAQLMGLIDYKISKVFASEFNAETEVYPVSIQCSTLDRCNHFSSFPEHMNFVSNLRQDVDTLEEFSQSCKEGDWSSDLHDENMANIEFALSPSCCYHCYEGMEGWELEYPGRCTTMTLDCHRFEGANMTTLSRLGSFTMREVVWVGHPEYVKSSRARADELIIDWAKHWELVCTLENANDMFFTDDYAVKASFQRQQEAKKELQLYIPQEEQSISTYSSNFHSVTFGKAFNIKVRGRPAASGCVGWGLHRWIYAIFSQFGFEPENWPKGLQEDFEEFCAQSSEGGWCK